MWLRRLSFSDNIVAVRLMYRRLLRLRGPNAGLVVTANMSSSRIVTCGGAYNVRLTAFLIAFTIWGQPLGLAVNPAQHSKQSDRHGLTMPCLPTNSMTEVCHTCPVPATSGIGPRFGIDRVLALPAEP